MTFFTPIASGAIAPAMGCRYLLPYGRRFAIYRFPLDKRGQKCYDERILKKNRPPF